MRQNKLVELKNRTIATRAAELMGLKLVGRSIHHTTKPTQWNVYYTEDVVHIIARELTLIKDGEEWRAVVHANDLSVKQWNFIKVMSHSMDTLVVFKFRNPLTGKSYIQDTSLRKAKAFIRRREEGKRV